MKRLFIALSMALSITTAFSQNITNAEYFFDADPGPGKGISISVGTPAPAVNFTAAIPTTNLSPGFHWLAIRTKDSDGEWSLFERRDFYIAQPTSDLPIITAAEYFFDHDPGVGNGTPVTIANPGLGISQQFSIPVPGNMPGGTHLLAIRMKDQAGHWSLFAKDSISVGGVAATISCPANVEVNSLPNLCYAIVNNIDPTTSPAGAAYTYTLSGATTGTGNGSASGLHFGTGVTTVTYALASSPSISCSFTITVKTIPSVSISALDSASCPGSSVNFLALPVNAGSNPTYQWKLNGLNVGTNNKSYVDTAVANGDKITVVLTSSLSCANPSTATSNPIILTTNGVTPSVTVTASTTTPCYGHAVTFTANPVYGGDSPVYTWRINNNYFPGGPTFQSTFQDGDSVSVQMHSNYDCAGVRDVQSGWVVMHVTPSVMQNLSINASATSICPGQTVTFTAVPENASSPVYQWKLNGNNVGGNSPSYQNSTLANHDTVQLSMTSSGCVIPQTVNSNRIVMNVSGGGNPSVSINATSTSICLGQQVVFTATPTNGGTNPVYEWTVNNNAVNTVNSNTYQSSTLHNGDVVRVTMSLSGGCAGNNTPVYSNSVTMQVNPTVSPSVVITASSIDICSGQQVTFTANPVNGGNKPSYQWKLNGINVGGDSAIFKTSALANADTVKVVMTSSLGCASPQTVTSNKISMDVSSSVTASVTIAASATEICSGSQVTFTATPTNGGSPNYEWRLNGNKVGTNNNTYQSSTLLSGDSIAVYMTSSLPCANPKTVKSNVIAITVTNAQTFYRDLDSDGYGSSASGTIQSCTAPAGYVTNNNDCNDNNANVHPGLSEICGNGTDENCNGLADENCGVENLPMLLVRTYPAKEGNVGETILNAVIALDKPAPANATVYYKTVDEDAKAGSDYVATSGWLSFRAGDSSATMRLKILGDMVKEGNERFTLRFSQPSGLLLNADSLSRVMIIDDDYNIKKLLSLTIPTMVGRNQIWQIPGIDNFENEVLIIDANGQVVRRFINYHNQAPVGNIAIGLYFYRITIREDNGELKTYTGRLLVTE